MLPLLPDMTPNSHIHLKFRDFEWIELKKKSFIFDGVFGFLKYPALNGFV